MSFAELEAERTRRLAWRMRGEYTPAQYCALVIAARGNGGELLVCCSKPTLRVLLRRGVIDSKGRITRAGELLVRDWVRKDREAKQ